jgi:LysM repeat protein
VLVSSHRWLTVASLAVLLAGTLLVACGGGGSDSNQAPDLSKLPTATPPNPLPDVILVNGGNQPGGGTTYTVEDGDNLSLIAEEYGVSVDAIAAANNITDPTTLFVGQVLTIPGGNSNGGSPAASPTPAPRATATPARPSGGQQTYTVREGDIPETIAAQYGITADELMAANGITDPTSLQVGQELVIPTPVP